MCFGDGLLNVCERPAKGLGDLARDLVAEFGFGDGLGIFEPSDGFGGGGVLAGLCALGGVGLYERVHSRENHRLWSTTALAAIYCGSKKLKPRLKIDGATPRAERKDA